MGWKPPRKLRKIHSQPNEFYDFLYELRKIDIEAGRQRMVKRGLYQYATPEELKALNVPENWRDKL